jgi:hypothetical protein
MTKTEKQIILQEIQPKDSVWSLHNLKAMLSFKRIYLLFILKATNTWSSSSKAM